MTVADVANWCNVSDRTVYRWLKDGLPAHRLPGTGARGLLRISSADLEDWLAQFRCAEDPDSAAEQMIHLDGRQFMATPNTSEYGLDDRHWSRSCAAEGRRQ